MKQLEYAKDPSLMGAERKSAVVAEENRRSPRTTRAGTRSSRSSPKARGRCTRRRSCPEVSPLGMVMQLPEKDELNLTKKQLLAMLDVTMRQGRRGARYSASPR